MFRGEKFTRAMKKKRPPGVTHLTSIPLLSGGDKAEGHMQQQTEKQTDGQTEKKPKRCLAVVCASVHQLLSHHVSVSVHTRNMYF